MACNCVLVPQTKTTRHKLLKAAEPRTQASDRLVELRQADS